MSSASAMWSKRSVQRDQNRVAASTRSLSTRRQARIFGRSSFEEDVADLFKLQDQVVARLGNITLGFDGWSGRRPTRARAPPTLTPLI